MNYKYQKKAFNSTIEVFNSENIVGEIKFSSWKSGGQAEINGRKYLLKKKGFWSRDLIVENTDNQEIVAELLFETWNNKVSINLSSTDAYLFTHKGFWQKNWFIFGKEKQVIEFFNIKNFWNNTGELKSNISDSQISDLLIVIGIFLVLFKFKEAQASSSS